MKTVVSILLVVSQCMFMLFPAYADNSRGAALYENHCLACHTADVHTREDRVDSKIILRAWVDSWSRHSGLGWNATDVDEVTEYLNARFYRFKD